MLLGLEKLGASRRTVLQGEEYYIVERALLNSFKNESKEGVMVQMPRLQHIGKLIRGGEKCQTDGEKL